MGPRAVSFVDTVSLSRGSPEDVLLFRRFNCTISMYKNIPVTQVEIFHPEGTRLLN